MMKALDELNEAQRKAVIETEGFIRLTAGAGSGKTRTLVTRYLYLTDMIGIDPDNILCFTFTRKAAEEMKKRIAENSSMQMEGSRISTYHGFCHSVIREDGNRLHLRREFEIIDESEQEKIFRQIYEDLGLTLKDGELADLNRSLSIYKSNTNYIQWFEGLNTRSYQENLLAFDGELNKILSNPNYRMELDEITRFSSTLSHYLSRQLKDTRFDFSDLLNLTLHLFVNDSYVLEKWQNRMQYIMVDEFQDSSLREQMLLTYLSGKYKNLFVVGDPDQSIYSFKGGDINVFLDFTKTFPNVQDLYLNENYRSTKQIVDLSNELIAKNTNRLDKRSIAKRDKGEPITHFHCKTDKQEMEFIINKIQEIIDQKKYTWKNIAIILRTHRSKKSLEQALVKAGFPYNIADGIKFYARKEIQQAIAYIKMLQSDDNDALMLTINTPKRRVGENLLNAIRQVADKQLCSYYQALKHLKATAHPEFTKTHADDYIQTIDWLRTRLDTPLSTLVSDLLRSAGYLQWLHQGANQSRIDNVEDLLDSIRLLEHRRQQPVSLAEYLQIVEEFTRTADEDEKKDEIQIMTIHSSKGLEFKVVFLPFFNDGLIPNAKSLSNIKLLEEERRLSYVAITRAEDVLFITDSEGQTERGSTKKPSRFLFDFDRSQIIEPKPINPELVQQFIQTFQKKEKLLSINETENRKVGDIVIHKVFGKGKIISITDKNYGIKFDIHEEIRSISKHIPLQDELSQNVVANSVEPLAENILLREEIKVSLEVSDNQFVEETSSFQQHSMNENENPVTFQKTALSQAPNPASTDAQTNLAEISNIYLNKQNTVEHPLWGTGFIKLQENTYYEIYFPEIKEIKYFEFDSKAIKHNYH